MSPHRLQRQSNYARSHCIISFTESCCQVACVQLNVGRFTNFNCLFCVYCVVSIALCIPMPASSYIHIYVCEERKKEKAQTTEQKQRTAKQMLSDSCSMPSLVYGQEI